jgi:hypothetical protein
MKTLCFTIILTLALFPCRLTAEDGNSILKRTAEALAPALAKLDPKADVSFDDNGNTLVITYLPQSYKIHGRSMSGEISPTAHDEIGPSYKGFVMRASIQSKGEIIQAVTPQTLTGPYWKSDIDVTPVEGTTSQLFWGLSYGSRTDSAVLSELRAILSNRKNKTEQTDALNSHAFGTFGTSPAEQALVPKASGSK